MASAARVEELFRAYNGLLVSDVLRTYGDADLAEEAASYVWEALLGRPEPRGLGKMYVLTCVRREAWRIMERGRFRRDQLARAGLTRVQLDLLICDGDFEQGEIIAAPGPSVEELALDRIEARKILEEVAGFTEAQRRPWPGYLMGGSYEEIGDLEGISRTAVNRHLTEGRARIRAALA